MKTKLFLLLCCALGFIACTDQETPLPTLQPTIVPIASPVPPTSDSTTNDASEAPTIEAPDEADSLDSPATSTATADPALQEIDQAVCQEAFKTQAELESRQAQGQDVSELATAVAELVGEMSQCASFYTPTPFP